MKSLLKKLFPITVAIFLANNATAQNTKTAIFANQPNEISCTAAQLDAVFNQTVNSDISLTLTPNFVLLGKVQSSLEKQANLKSVIIRLSNFPDVIFSISKISDQYTSERYVGRLMSNKYSDAYELFLQENGSYIFSKKITDHIIQPCKN
jgi:hypothetical protein